MNRRILVCVLTCTAFTLGLGAPDLSAQTLGVKGGTHLSAITFDDNFAEPTILQPGLTGGGFLSVGLFWRTSIAVEGLVTLERTTLEGAVDGRFRYVDIPVVVRRPLPWAAGGGSVSVVVGGMYRRIWEATETVADESYSITDGVQESDVAILAGLEVPVRPRLSVDVRYLHGRNGIYRRARGGYSGAWRGIEVAARYGF